MRSRPDVSVLLDPFAPKPGDRLRAVVRLQSHSVTPYDAIDVTLIGRESRYKNTTSTGKTTTTHYHRREICRLGARFEAGVLQPGLWEREVNIDIPLGTPPAYKSPLSRIQYDLAVRVHIPWWPDRHAHYDLGVVATPYQGGTSEAQSFTSQAGEYRGEEPVIEMSLDDTVLEPGGTIRGAIAVTGLGSRRVRRVEIACCTHEAAVVWSAAGPRDVSKSTWKLLETRPAEGEATRFNLRIPNEIAPAFRSPFIHVSHYLEARVVVAFGKDVVLRAPIRIAPLAEARHAAAQAAAPLVGRERQLAVWNIALDRARRAGFQSLAFEPDRDRVTFAIDGIEGSITEENREDLGPCLVTSLHWPTLGLGMRVADRRWTDFGARPEGIFAGFAKDYAVRAREAGQVTGLLDERMHGALTAFEESALDDDGAVVLRRGGVHQLPGLERYITLVKSLCETLAPRIARVPPPAALASAVSGWQRVAELRGARLCVGDLSLHDWSVRGVPVDVGHVWDGATAVATTLTTQCPENHEPRKWAEQIARDLGGEPFVEERNAGVKLARVEDPERLAPLVEKFALSVSALLGVSVNAPYR